MKIGFCSDHAGFAYKTRLIEALKAKGHETVDFGTDSTASMDYPDVAHPLAEAVDGNRTKEVPGLLDTYLSAIKAKDRVDNSCAEKYRKVLPDEKVAKLYVAEERFRRQQIHKLHHGGK